MVSNLRIPSLTIANPAVGPCTHSMYLPLSSQARDMWHSPFVSVSKNVQEEHKTFKRTGSTTQTSWLSGFRPILPWNMSPAPFKTQQNSRISKEKLSTDAVFKQFVFNKSKVMRKDTVTQSLEDRLMRRNTMEKVKQSKDYWVQKAKAALLPQALRGRKKYQRFKVSSAIAPVVHIKHLRVKPPLSTYTTATKGSSAVNGLRSRMMLQNVAHFKFNAYLLDCVENIHSNTNVIELNLFGAFHRDQANRRSHWCHTRSHHVQSIECGLWYRSGGNIHY